MYINYTCMWVSFEFSCSKPTRPRTPNIEKLNLEWLLLEQKFKAWPAAENQRCFYNFDLSQNFSNVLYGQILRKSEVFITVVWISIWCTFIHIHLISQDAPYQQYTVIAWKEDTAIGVRITCVNNKWKTYVVVWMSNKLKSSKPAVKSRRPRRHGNRCRGFDLQIQRRSLRQ